MHEWFLLGLPGPTHVHAGIAPGNIASQQHRDHHGSPRRAALQVLDLARVLIDRGQRVAVLPPLPRPDREFLAEVGLDQHPERDDGLLRIASSSASMWAANAATVIPAADRGPAARTLVIPANLIATSHRALECAGRTQHLRALLDPRWVEVRAALPAIPELADEGAANHHRLSDGRRALHVIVHGREAGSAEAAPRRFSARQPRAVGAAIARLAGIEVLAIRQHPDAIDAGAFHNDVVMVGHRERILLHQRAWCDQDAALDLLRQRLPSLRVACIADHELSLGEAVRCYLFNSVLIDGAAGAAPWLVAPGECASGAAQAVIRRLIAEDFISGATCVDVRESMMGGGGPACLRLRLLVDEAAIHPGIRLDHARIDGIAAVVAQQWPATLTPAQLADPGLPDVDARARAALAAVLDLPRQHFAR